MLKTTAPSTLIKLACTKINENGLDTDGSGGIGSVRINNKIKILSNSINWRRVLEQIFLSPELKKSSVAYKKLLPRLQFLGILI